MQAIETGLRDLHRTGCLIVVRRPILSVNAPSLYEDCYLATPLAQGDLSGESTQNIGTRSVGPFASWAARRNVA